MLDSAFRRAGGFIRIWSIMLLSLSLSAVAGCGLLSVVAVLEPPEYGYSDTDQVHDFEITASFRHVTQPGNAFLGYEIFYKWYQDDSVDFENDIEQLSSTIIDDSRLEQHHFFRFRPADNLSQRPSIPIESPSEFHTRIQDDGYLYVDVYEGEYSSGDTPDTTIRLIRNHQNEVEDSELQIARPQIHFSDNTTEATDFSPSVRTAILDAEEDNEEEITLRLGIIVLAYGLNLETIQPLYSPPVSPQSTNERLYRTDMDLN